MKYICMNVKTICSNGLTPWRIWKHGEVGGISKKAPNSSPLYTMVPSPNAKKFNIYQVFHEEF